MDEVAGLLSAFKKEREPPVRADRYTREQFSKQRTVRRSLRRGNRYKMVCSDMKEAGHAAIARET